MKNTPSNKRKNACGAMNSLLGPYLFDELERDERKRLEKHLSACPTCRRELAAMRQATAKLQAELAAEPRLALSEARKKTLLDSPASAPPECGTNRWPIGLWRVWHSPAPRAAVQLAAVFIGLAVIAALVVPGLLSVTRRRHPERFDEKSAPAIVAEPAAETDRDLETSMNSIDSMVSMERSLVAEGGGEDARRETTARIPGRHRALAARQPETRGLFDADGSSPLLDLADAPAEAAAEQPSPVGSSPPAPAPPARPTLPAMPKLRREKIEPALARGVGGDATADVGARDEPPDRLEEARRQRAPSPAASATPAALGAVATAEATGGTPQVNPNPSYVSVRENLRQDRLPPPEEVRVEEFVQAFAPSHAPLAEAQLAEIDGRATATLADEALADQTVEDAPHAFLLAGAAEFANLLQRDQAAPPELFGNLRRLIERVARAQPDNERAHDLLDLVRQAETVSGRQ